jgi:hypothetical protein
MKKNIVLVIFAVAVLAMLSMPAYASLEPMSWGFPSLIQNDSLLHFENSVAWQTNFEFADISFPTSTSSWDTSNLGFATFPQITQITNNSAFMQSFSYTNQQASSVFTYPWISIGFSPVPSMGFL